MLGLKGPWKEKVVQFFVAIVLELAAEVSAGPPNRQVLDYRDGRGSTQQPWDPQSAQLFREACAVYVGAPVIPRFAARLRKSLSRLREQGILRAPDGCKAPALEQALASFLGEGPHADTNAGQKPHDLGGGNARLEAYRERDALHHAFRNAVASKAVLEHFNGSCFLDVRSHVMA